MAEIVVEQFANPYPEPIEDALAEEAREARLADEAFGEALRLLQKHRAALDRIALALLDKETLDKDELAGLLEGIDQESRSSETVGTVRVIAAE